MSRKIYIVRRMSYDCFCAGHLLCCLALAHLAIVLAVASDPSFYCLRTPAAIFIVMTLFNNLYKNYISSVPRDNVDVRNLSMMLSLGVICPLTRSS